MSNTDTSAPTETELLWLPKTCQSALQLLDVKNIAIQIGAKSSPKAVLIDGTEENSDRLLIFHLKFLHSADDCFNFLAGYDDKDLQLSKVLVNKLMPQLPSRLNALAERFQEVNFAEQIPKSAALLADLAELHPQELFYLTEDLDRKIGQFKFCLIDSNQTHCRITRISRSNGFQGQSEDLPESTRNMLLEVRRRLSTEFGKAEDANELHSEDDALTLSLSRLSDAAGTNIASIVKPAVNLYADLIRSELSRSTTDTKSTLIAFAESLFAAKPYRDAVLNEFQGVDAVTIRFVKDPKFIGMLGALIAEAK